jgi:hypothetical protein
MSETSVKEYKEEDREDIVWWEEVEGACSVGLMLNPSLCGCPYILEGPNFSSFGVVIILEQLWGM